MHVTDSHVYAILILSFPHLHSGASLNLKSDHCSVLPTTMTVMNPDVLLAHIATQTRGNLEFLLSQKQLTESECHSLLQKLRTIEDTSRITEQTQNATIAPSTVSSPAPNTPISRAEAPYPVSPTSSVPRPLSNPPGLFRVRAIWGYNEHNEVRTIGRHVHKLDIYLIKIPRDLSFSPGDIIDVLKENNGDWWEGRCNGKIGLFPSNYVERITSPGFPALPANNPPAWTGEKFTSHVPTPYQPPQYPQSNPSPYAPPPMTYPNPPGPPPNQPPQVVVAANEEQNPNKPKKHFLQGKLGNTVCHTCWTEVL